MKRCSESEMTVDCLEAGTEYSVRVSPVRLCQDEDISGAFSPSKTFSTPSSLHLPPANSSKSSSNQVATSITAIVCKSRLNAMSLLPRYPTRYLNR